MFEVFIENFCKEKQAAWLEGCVEVYMAQYAKKAENDYPKEAVMRIAKATFEKGIDIQDVIEFSELPEELLSALDEECFKLRVQAAQQVVLMEAQRERAIKIAQRMFQKGCTLQNVREHTEQMIFWKNCRQGIYRSDLALNADGLTRKGRVNIWMR